ncbi:hypothetical protein WMY93_004216 [Mugilogobius chulae]|uniref:C-type lectin domain-containing protein n=1 Tax=Mugilogobius chulae TaxID=88201 RepID=A0AAW0Q2V8_9GOBI
MNLSWDKLTGLTTDGAPAMCGEKSGLVGRLPQKMQSEGNADDICQFLETKEKDTARLRDVKWRWAGTHSHRHVRLCASIQSQAKPLGDSTSAEKPRSLPRVPKYDDAHHRSFPVPTKHFVEKLSTLRAEFTRRFTDFERQKFNFEMFSNPFSIDPEKAPENLQMELIELQCDSALKSKYETVGRVEFHRCLPETMPQLRRHAARILSMFGSTYVCEQLFSVMKLNKSSHRSSLTDAHLHSILRVSTAQDLTPNITELVIYVKKTSVDAEKSCQSFGANLASIHSDEENSFISELIKTTTGAYTVTLIGGSDAMQEGKWLWSDGSVWGFTSWNSGEPNNHNGYENCIETNAGKPRMWNDVPCAFRYIFVCAKDLQNAPGAVSLTLQDINYHCSPK